VGAEVVETAATSSAIRPGRRGHISSAAEPTRRAADSEQPLSSSLPSQLPDNSPPAATTMVRAGTAKTGGSRWRAT